MRTFPYALLLVLAALSGCSNRASKGIETSETYQNSIKQLNARDFEGAIASLEVLHQAQPQNQEVSRRLMHAYAGSAGFEAPKFKDTLERLAKDKGKEKLKASVEEFKRIHSLQKISQEHVKSFRARKITNAMIDAVDEIPLLNKAQYARLNQAIDLYEKGGFSYKTSSKDDNFQWGLIYTYRMLANVRYIADELNGLAEGKDKRSNQQIERIFIRAWNMVSWDAFHAYKLFRHSYDRLQRIGIRVEEFLSRISGRRINARLLDESKSAADIVRFFLDENRDITAELIERVEGRIRQGDFEFLLNNAFREFRNESAEVRFHKSRMRAVIRVYLDQFDADHKEEIKELRDLFNEEMRQEIRSAYADSLREETFDAFHRLYRDSNSQFRRAWDLADILAQDVKTEELQTELKPHALALRDKVDETQLRIAKQELDDALRDIGYVLKDEQALYQENYDYLLRMLKERAKNVESILEEEVVYPAKPLVEELSKGDKEFNKKAQLKIRNTKRFITR